MARPLEQRGYFVRDEDPLTPIHCKIARAAGMTRITEEDARRLSAGKRTRARHATPPVPQQPSPPVSQSEVTPEVAPNPPAAGSQDLTLLAEAVLALGRRVETVERDLSGVPVVVAELFQQARAEEERGT